jgi:hypothetical protein
LRDLTKIRDEAVRIAASTNGWRLLGRADGEVHWLGPRGRHAVVGDPELLPPLRRGALRANLIAFFRKGACPVCGGPARSVDYGDLGAVDRDLIAVFPTHSVMPGPTLEDPIAYLIVECLVVEHDRGCGASPASLGMLRESGR